jgi:hypothetical protein
VLTGHVRQLEFDEQVVQVLGQVKHDDATFSTGLYLLGGQETQFPLVK